MMKRVIFLVVASFLIYGCGIGKLVENKLSREGAGLVGSDYSWADIEMGWKLLSEWKCAEALKVTDRVWGREGWDSFEDVTVLRLRGLVCVGRYDEALWLTKWMKVMFPWRGEDLDATELFIRHAKGEDIGVEVWEGVRRYPFGWMHRLIGLQLLALEGRLRDAREQYGVLEERMEEMGKRCGYEAVGHVGRGLERALGRSGVERYFVEVGAAEGVFERGGILGVVVDYCHDSDGRGGRAWGEEVMKRVVKSMRRGDGSCSSMVEKGDYEEFFWRCVGGIDFSRDRAEDVLVAGNYALMVGATGIARTAGEALLRRHELEGEARVLLGRVWNVEGYRARAFDELQVKEW